jgi:hypothetical protein
VSRKALDFSIPGLEVLELEDSQEMSFFISEALLLIHHQKISTAKQESGFTDSSPAYLQRTKSTTPRGHLKLNSTDPYRD